MSDSATGFAQFVPGFDFLQSLAKGASSMPQMPQMASWVAPTLNAEELDKRITDLKAVQYWLEQNARVLGATIQALEVQRLTLATLQGMNVSLGEVANAFKFKPSESQAAASAATQDSPLYSRTANRAAAPAQGAGGDAQEPEAPAARVGRTARSTPAKDAQVAPSMVDPMQLWGALTQQFQQIAAAAMKDVAKASAVMESATKEAEGASVARSPVKAAAKVPSAGTRTAKPRAAASKGASPKSRAGVARKGAV